MTSVPRSTQRSSVVRRLGTIPGTILLLAVVVVLAPLLIPVALVIDAVRWGAARTPFMAVRLILFFLAYLTIEVIGLMTLSMVWFASGLGRRPAALHDATLRVQRAWAEAVFRVVTSVFGLTFAVEGVHRVATGPLLLFARHTSIVDNLLAAHFIARPHRMHIAYIMKSELLVDPCLDVAGNRLPNVFVRRGSGESDRDLAAIRAVATNLSSNEAVLIYPEGTRFSPEKLGGALRRLERSPTRLGEIAAGFTKVLPPRLSGPLALLDASTADVVVMAHRGLEGFARIADIWKGAMVGTHVEVAFWRVPRAEIPTGRADRAEWLFDLWSRLDAWVSHDRPPVEGGA